MLELFRRMGFVPLRCTWEITLACNLRCGHCGSRAGQARPDELDADEAKVVIDDLAALGCREVSLAGGEPTLRPDWDALVARIAGHGLWVAVVSNGLTWWAEHTRRAKAAGIACMGFSLDGLERTHDCVRKAQDSYRKVLAAVASCLDAGIPVTAITHITRRNLAELEELHALLGRRGVRNWQVQLGVPMGNLAEEPESILGAAEIAELLPRLVALRKSGRPPRVVAADNLGYYGTVEEELREPGSRVSFWVGCRAGLEVLGIESNGDVKGCLSLHRGRDGGADFVEGNLRRRRLAEIWNDPDAFAYNRKFRVEDLRGACAGCEYGEICRGGCTSASVASSGHPHAYPHCFCKVAG
jgi:radical SAM protein with 4Fe4S-binding SPASM domain